MTFPQIVALAGVCLGIVGIALFALPDGWFKAEGGTRAVWGLFSLLGALGAVILWTCLWLLSGCAEIQVKRLDPLDQCPPNGWPDPRKEFGCAYPSDSTGKK